MQQTDPSLNRITEVISKGNSGIILIPPHFTPDSIAAATSLYLALTKLGKTIGLVCEKNITSELIASDKFQTTASTTGDNLVVSFPYAEGAIDKVDYTIQGNFFNLVVIPRAGFPKLDTKQVKFSYSGGVVHFIIVLDAPTVNSLGSIYTENQTLFQGKDIINVDRHITNSMFGTINYIDKSISSLSELVLKIIMSLSQNIDKDIATNLYAGIAGATNNFSSYSVTANTFEVASQLLRAGASRRPMASSPQRFQQFPSRPSFSPSSFPRTPPTPTFTPPMMPPMNPPQVTGTHESEPQVSEKTQNPQDWLKPKIFGGSGLV